MRLWRTEPRCIFLMIELVVYCRYKDFIGEGVRNMFRIQHSYFVKMILAFLLLIGLPFLLISLLTVDRFQSYIEMITEKSAQKVTRQLELNLDSYFEEIGRLAVYPLYNDAILDIIVDHADPEGSKQIMYDESLEVSNLLTSLLYARDDVYQSLLFLLDGNILPVDSLMYFSRWDQSNLDWMKAADKTPDRYVILPYQKNQIYRDKDQQRISVAQALRHPKTLEIIGYMKIDMRIDSIKPIMSQVEFSENSKLYIFDRNQELIYPLGIEQIPEVKDGKTVINGQQYLVNTSYSAATQLTILSLLSEDDLKQDIMEIISLLVIISAAVLLCSLIAAVFISRRITRPISELRDNMALVSQGRLDTRVDVTSRDEISQLQSVFNVMTSRLDYLVNQVYCSKISEQNAQISALQSQINPHFLYNTLETINMMAILQGNDDVSKAISKLGEMLRYNVDNEQRFVTLSEEMEYTRTYFDIQRLCNKALNMQIESVPGVAECFVPKQILQPFIENIIEHAQYDSKLNVLIRIAFKSEALIIGIYDNGKPLDEKTLQKIRISLRKQGLGQYSEHELEQANRRKGYGLSNVQQRIVLLFGQDYGVSLDESYKDGTGFIIRLKFLTQLESEADHDAGFAGK